MGWLSRPSELVRAVEEAAPYYQQDYLEGVLGIRAGTSQLEQVMVDMIAGAGTTTAADIRTLPGVAAAVRLLSGHISGLPAETTTDAPPPKWLAWPRYNGSPFDWPDMLQYLVDSMIIHGKGYLLATCTAAGPQPSFRLEPVDPNYVQVRSRTDGVVGMVFLVGGTEVPTPPWAMTSFVEGRTYLVHIPYRVSVEHPEGTTPLVDAAVTLRGHVKTEKTAAEVLDSTRVGGFMTTDHDLTTTQATEYQTAVMASFASGRIPVMGSGLTYKNEVPNPVDMQLVETRSFNQSVVWSLLGIPQSIMGSSMMGGQSSLSYSNAQDNERLYSRNALRPIGEQITFSVSQLLPHGNTPADDQMIQFDYSAWEVTSEPNDPAVGDEPAGSTQ